MSRVGESAEGGQSGRGSRSAEEAPARGGKLGSSVHRVHTAITPQFAPLWLANSSGTSEARV
jgi:hypothetical protein